MSTNNGGHYQDIQKSVRAGSPNGYEEGEEHRYYNTNSLLFVANLTSLNPFIEFTLSVIILFCSGYLLGSKYTN